MSTTLRNILIGIVLLVIIAHSVSAQVRIGVLGGLTASDLSLKQTGSPATNFSNLKGLGLGVVLDYDINHYFGLRFEPMYIQKRVQKETNDPEFGLVRSRLKTSYFEFPMLFNLSLNRGGINPYLLGGATVSFLLNAQEAYNDEFLEFGFENNQDIKDQINNIDYGYTLGGGLSLPIGNSSVFIEGRYTRGLADFNNAEANFPVTRTKGWQFLTGINFQIGASNDVLMQQEPEEDDDGDDPRDAPKPIIYGEEIDDNTCSPEFIVTPPPECKLEKKEIPDIYKGKICYIVFPGSQWEKNSPVPKIIEAQKFYEKYCIYLNFEEIDLTPKQKKKYKKWYEKWHLKLRNRHFPKGHIRKWKKDMKKKYPDLTEEEIENRIEEEIKEKLRTITIPRGLWIDFYNTMYGMQKAASKKGCKKTLVIFIDEYICRNPKPTRTSATQLKFNQVGIEFIDNASNNILSHELAHLLGKNPIDGRGSQITWEHNKCTNAVLHTIREDRRKSYNFADYLSYEEYKIMIKHKAGIKKVKLIKKIN